MFNTTLHFPLKLSPFKLTFIYDDDDEVRDDDARLQDILKRKSREGEIARECEWDA